tara:strand:- start:5873 stop:6976 length:1104 start_codon:yes stop_codon:yes gene_type:complete
MDFGSLEEFGQSAGTSIGNIAPALAAAYMLGPQALQGAFYSAGGETFAAERHFGHVFSEKTAGEAGFANTVRGGQTNARLSRDGGLFKSKPIVDFIDDAGDTFTRATDGTLQKGGLQKLTKMSIGIPVAMTAFGAVHAASTEGVEGLRDYMIQDVFANYHGMRESNVIYNITDATKAETSLGMAKNSLSTGNIKSVSTQRSVLGSPMMGRMMPIMGGYVGAMAGMAAGRATTEGAASFLNKAYGLNINEGVAGMVGSIFGAAEGARVGAYLFGTPLKAGVAGIGIMAGTMLFKSTYSALEAGFKHEEKNKGLNFASDVSAHFTQNAVTMRQRALQSMHKSHTNARSAFGQEASIVHMNRDMFSHHRR